MASSITLRRLPYPYAAALSICSDLDETPTADVYFETARFLNTRETTRMGPGVGLEVGNSIYFDMPPTQFAYWNTDDRGRAAIRALIRSGHIDCIHSFGDLASTRAHAERAIDELTRHDCRLEVWVDHSRVPSNFGHDVTRGEGDQPGSPAYHADLTRAFGIKYVWRGRVTSVIGQARPATFGGLLSRDHPWRSTATAGKELAKYLLARGGSAKYAMHGPNDVYRVVTLRDGGSAIEFLRCNPAWGGVSHEDDASGLGGVLRPALLRRLVDRGGIMILYTHLGKFRSREEPLPPLSQEGLRAVAEQSRSGRLFVTTTRRLLQYLVARDYLRFRAERSTQGGLVVTLDAVDDPRVGPRPPCEEEVQGLTFVSSEKAVKVRFSDGRELVCVTVATGDTTYVTVPWRPLQFPIGAI